MDEVAPKNAKHIFLQVNGLQSKIQRF